MLVETQLVRSKSELMSVIQRMTISQAVVYRNVDKKAWEQIAKGHLGAIVVAVIARQVRTSRLIACRLFSFASLRICFILGDS